MVLNNEEKNELLSAFQRGDSHACAYWDTDSVQQIVVSEDQGVCLYDYADIILKILEEVGPDGTRT